MNTGPGAGRLPASRNGWYVKRIRSSLPIAKVRRHDRQGPGPLASSRCAGWPYSGARSVRRTSVATASRSEEHTSELQSLAYLVCRLLLEKKRLLLAFPQLCQTRIFLCHTTPP